MTDISPEAQAAQDLAREANGRFGRQDHTAPEAELAVDAPVKHTSVHLDALHREEAKLQHRQRELAGVIVEEHIIDAARALPAEARTVHYRVDPKDEGGAKMLMFEFVADGDGEDLEDLDPNLRDFAYEVGWSFGHDDDLDYRGWVEEDETGEYVALRFDEDEADRLIEKYQADIDQDMALYGFVDPQLRRGKEAWLERSIRMRAADHGIARVHLNYAPGAEGVELTHFEDARGELRRPNADDPGDAFILARAAKFTRRTDGMQALPDPDTGFTLDV